MKTMRNAKSLGGLWLLLGLGGFLVSCSDDESPDTTSDAGTQLPATPPEADASGVQVPEPDGGVPETPTSSEDAGEATSTDAGAEEVGCGNMVPLVSGMTYKEITLFALRVALDLAPGEYSVLADEDTAGLAHIFREDAELDTFEYDASATLENNTRQTIAAPGFFEFDVQSQTQTDLSWLGESIFDGCHSVVVEDAATIMAGGQYGPIVVEELSIDSAAPSGTYTFFTESGNSGSVELRLDGTPVDTLTYAWMTTIGGEDSFTFEFPGVLTLQVNRAMGMSNLFAMADSIFDGRHQVEVP